MSTFIIKVSDRGIERFSYRGQDLEWLQQQVGGYIEAANNQFPDPSIVILCNEEGLIQDLPVFCRTRKELFSGSILVLSEHTTVRGVEFCGLSENQCAIAYEHLELLVKVS
jgi:hypothetical protein